MQTQDPLLDCLRDDLFPWLTEPGEYFGPDLLRDVNLIEQVLKPSQAANLRQTD
jgi:hypothetical protein